MLRIAIVGLQKIQPANQGKMLLRELNRVELDIENADLITTVVTYQSSLYYEARSCIQLKRIFLYCFERCYVTLGLKPIIPSSVTTVKLQPLEYK